MRSSATTVASYLKEIPAAWLPAMQKLRTVILEHLPEGYEEVMSYGMIGYVVPHRLYPPGYHCSPELPLPFMNIASQKSGIALYHMGLYADTGLMEWFLNAYREVSVKKPDVGKSCIRFSKPELIPFDLIGKLSERVSVPDWIGLYERSFVPNKNRRSSGK
ncbi:DUF1801 domain-containing protein [Niabella drilacis]|uniref:YdhG-like domain-containing protein n=1 Tax=Niabella drilacis (strain DSM 25811 / CCM 8410 / CCUG 62505 / LMG 26954 / E90) TaxID=1285928 RepID=A0A1G7AU16_NIADE|nr:DUF1801 domain-containing protein [Niabella drilacis]SDE18374.1 protein of unknown function (DU1801) [Niabella drilacis]